MSFAERDRIAGMKRWEEMTGEIHPENLKNAPKPICLPSQILEISNDKSH
jgi:hypothetical protein